ncbi:MAG TPA: hypothetical protein GX517_11930 [Alicyclobacillus sp.]|nr:hypothetical protein [Alicyclobacillus sp.]
MIRVDDIVEWESQSQGFWKTKKGRVLAIVPAGRRIEDVWRTTEEIPKSRMKWTLIESEDGTLVSEVSRFDRAVVEVPRASGKVCEYYAPRLTMLRKCDE